LAWLRTSAGAAKKVFFKKLCRELKIVCIFALPKRGTGRRGLGNQVLDVRESLGYRSLKNWEAKDRKQIPVNAF